MTKRPINGRCRFVSMEGNVILEFTIIKKRLLAAVIDHTLVHSNTDQICKSKKGHRLRHEGDGVIRLNYPSDLFSSLPWHILQGSRDGGIVVITVTAYRVCQSSNAGPNTAFTHQQSATAMMRDGVVNPRPRKQLLILIDLAKFIEEKRSEG